MIMDVLWLIGSVLGLAGLGVAGVKVFILDPYTDRQYRKRIGRM